MPVQKPQRIGDNYQIPFTVPAIGQKFVPETKNYSSGPVQITEEGLFKFSQPRWVNLTSPRGGSDIELCTDDNGTLNIMPHVIAEMMYILKFGNVDAAPPSETPLNIGATTTSEAPAAEPTPTRPSAADDVATITFKGPNSTGMQERQTFDAPFPGLVGAPTIENSRLVFANTTVSVEVEITGLGLNEAKTLTVKPSGVSLRSVGMLERTLPETYTLKVFRPKP